jgi:hypothetical protein
MLLLVSDSYYPYAVARTCEAADASSEPVRAGVEAIIAMAELDPQSAREALWRLQADWGAQERLEKLVGGRPIEAALRIGAAIHLARAELASPMPQLRSRLPELMELLEQRGPRAVR